MLDIPTDSDEELPAGWEERVTLDGKVFYANHNDRTTQWAHPKTKKLKYVTGELPYGWERQILPNDTVLYVDKLNNKTTYTDPRLAFAKIQHDDEKMRMPVFADNTSPAMKFLLDRNLSGHTAIVTGGNQGLGFEIAKSLAFAGCHVIIGCRTLEKGNQACQILKNERPYVNIESMQLDLSSLKSVKYFTDIIKAQEKSLNFLFLNAATFETEYKQSENEMESMFQVNHLAQFYLARLLLENLLKTPKSKIIVISCESHRGANLSKKDISLDKLNVNINNFDNLQQFCNTKLCNILFANELNRRLRKVSADVVCHSCHPGNLLNTNLFKKWLPIRALLFITSFFTKNMQQAAATPIYCAVAAPELSKEQEPGAIYWNNCYKCTTSVEAQDSILAYRLWEISESILIKKTQSFDNYLSNGDKFSSISSLSMPSSDE